VYAIIVDEHQHTEVRQARSHRRTTTDTYYTFEGRKALVAHYSNMRTTERDMRRIARLYNGVALE
jgi:hypothetical protein